jgi:hypothetical protein
MNASTKPIGYVLRHGKTVTFKHNKSEASFLIRDVDEMTHQVGLYQLEFSFGGPASVVLSGCADRCIETALLVVAALIPNFNPFPRIRLLEEYVIQAMDAEPGKKSDSWFATAVRNNLCSADDVIGNFPGGSVVTSIVLQPNLATASLLKPNIFPSDKVWVAVTHADVVAKLRRRDVSVVKHWNMYGISKLPWNT